MNATGAGQRGAHRPLERKSARRGKDAVLDRPAGEGDAAVLDLAGAAEIERALGVDVVVPLVSPSVPSPASASVPLLTTVPPV
jgi:hypothetical protein